MSKATELTARIEKLLEDGGSYNFDSVDKSHPDYKPMLNHLKKNATKTPYGKHSTIYQLGDRKYTHYKAGKEDSISGNTETIRHLSTTAIGKSSEHEANEQMPTTSLNIVKNRNQSAAVSHFGSKIPQSIKSEPSLNSEADHHEVQGSYNIRSANAAHNFLKQNGTHLGTSMSRESGQDVSHYQSGSHHYLVSHEPENDHTAKISSTHAGMSHLNSALKDASAPKTQEPSSGGIIASAKPMMKMANGSYARHDGSNRPISHIAY